MSWLFLLAAYQAVDYPALDRAHEAWAKCLIASPGFADGYLEPSQARPCEPEEAAVRSALAAEHPDATPSTLDDVMARFRHRIGRLQRSLMEERMRGSPACGTQPPFTISLGSPETLVDRMSAADLLYSACHGPVSRQGAIGYRVHEDGSVSRNQPGRPSRPGKVELWSLYLRHRADGSTQAQLTSWHSEADGDLCHFRAETGDDPLIDERVKACIAAIRAARPGAGAN